MPGGMRLASHSRTRKQTRWRSDTRRMAARWASVRAARLAATKTPGKAMASTCVCVPCPDSACLVLGCVRVCVLPQRLSKGKCIGSILDDRGRLRDAFYLIDKDHTLAARLCLA